MKNKTLLILAAGMGSRFGELKQVEPVGPSGEFIIEYSIYDAIRYGFNKVVFIIKKENYELFRDTVGKKIENKIKVEYVFQEIDYINPIYVDKINRVKPWGTTHAVLCAKDVINEPFLMINADDFYGKDAFLVASNYMDNNEDENKYSIICYKLCDTISKNGSVKRGVCTIFDNKITQLVESSIVKDGNILMQNPLGTDIKMEIDNDALVSMNMIVMYPNVFEYLDKKFNIFLKENYMSETHESIIVEELSNAIKDKYCEIEAVKTDSVWGGITYKEDLDEFKRFILNQINSGNYPNKLFND